MSDEGYTEALALLHEATRDIIHSDGENQIFATALEATDDILQLPITAIYKWNEQKGVLEPHAHSTETEDFFDSLPTFTGSDSIAWNAFVEREFKVVEDVKNHEKRYNSETAIETELYAPLGEHGILLSGSEEPNAFNQSDIELARILVENTTAALDRAKRDQRIKHQQKQLREQNEQLNELRRITDVFRDVEKAIISSSSRQEIQRAICENLSSIEPYRFVWIGQRNSDSEIQPQVWAGEHGEFLDQVYGTTEAESEQRPPAELALQTGEPQVIQNILSSDSFSPWRKEAMDRNFQSILALPLHFNETFYGVLEVYASEPFVFTDEECRFFEELGEVIANAFSAIERKEALITDATTELEFRLDSGAEMFSRIAEKADIELELETVVSRDNGTWLIYLTAHGAAPERILSSFRDLAIVESAQHIRTEGESDLFGVAITEFELADTFVDYGASLKTISASSDETSVVVSVSSDTDVRELVTACKESYLGLELVRREPNMSAASSRTDSLSLDSLTDRQREVLEVAFEEGYFKWPRDSNGQEIAERLHIASPTFHRHLRRGLQQHLETVFHD